jgi:hypothetical protein
MQRHSQDDAAAVPEHHLEGAHTKTNIQIIKSAATAAILFICGGIRLVLYMFPALSDHIAWYIDKHSPTAAQLPSTVCFSALHVASPFSL